MGIALAKGGRNIDLSKIGKISFGWVLTPLISMGISFVALNILQNVFLQPVVG
jgi:phosphate/sulfate permease